MDLTLGDLVAPATSLLARLVSAIPGMLVPGILLLAACLGACVLVDLVVDRASIASR